MVFARRHAKSIVFLGTNIRFWPTRHETLARFYLQTSFLARTHAELCTFLGSGVRFGTSSCHFVHVSRQRHGFGPAVSQVVHVSWVLCTLTPKSCTFLGRDMVFARKHAMSFTFLGSDMVLAKPCLKLLTFHGFFAR
jgi:hypothetical protein